MAESRYRNQGDDSWRGQRRTNSIFGDEDRDRSRSSGRHSGSSYERDEDDRSIFSRVGEEVRSWFEGDDDESQRGYGSARGSRSGGHRQSWDEANRAGPSSSGSHDGREHGFGGYQGDYGGGDRQGGFGGQGDYGRDRQSFSGGSQSGRSGSVHDDHYRSWRDDQIAALDRDYEDYRRERQQQFHSDFESWRRNRKEQGGGTGSMSDSAGAATGSTQSRNSAILGEGESKGATGQKTADAAGSAKTGSGRRSAT